MDKLWKKLGLPLVIIIIGSLLLQFIASLSINESNFIQQTMFLFVLFFFGMSLQQNKRKKDSGWISKLLISFVLSILWMHQIRFLNINAQLPLIHMLGLTNQTIAVPLIYVLSGYLFFA